MNKTYVLDSFKLCLFNKKEVPPYKAIIIPQAEEQLPNP
jgi:hypothetical protein